MRACAAAVAIFGCVLAAQAPANERLRVVFVDSVRIFDKDAGFTEPSGLALAADGGHLWSVSDDTKRLFRLGFDGAVAEEKSVSPAKKGMEGVAVAGDGKRLLLAREEGAEVHVLNIGGGSVDEVHRLADMQGYDSVAGYFAGKERNKGLEGVTVDPASGDVYVLKEGEPRLLVRLSPELDRVLDHKLLDRAAGFDDAFAHKGALDVSGIAYDPSRGLFWIVSDRGRRLFLFDWEAGRASSIELLATVDGKERRIEHAEGVAYSTETRRLYIVTDDGKASRFYVYRVD